MRRGHQGIGGWRNETPRHYRPRNGGNPHYRPNRNFTLLNPPRFPPPEPRSHRSNFSHRHENDDHDRYRYRSDLSHYSFTRSSDKIHHSERQILPLLQQNMKHSSNVNTNSYHGTPDRYHVNSMGDIDQRQTQHKRDFKAHPVPPWSVDNQYQDIDDRAYNRTYKNDPIEQNKTKPEYVGHRPPSSDHYGGNPISTIENSNTFSRSVDDTVNIVRKRLLSKNDSQQTPDSGNLEENIVESTNIVEAASSHHEQPVRKKLPRQRQNIKVNCDKIKNKIFHQLFKMDKEKIHKLLDNPNSSTKFEYAINSLLTESQNSFNQHLRSVAEKSLCSSSTEFMQNDNNTIYEDTFMKQMQCILDPQDTVFLEDIKPVVMAELSKVLQLDEFEHRFDANEVHNNFSSLHQNNESDYSQEYPQSTFTRRELPQSNTNESTNNTENYNYNFVNQADNYYMPYESQHTTQQNNDEPKPLFERRPRRKSCNLNLERNDTNKIKNVRKSVDSRLTDYFPREEKFIQKEETLPVFDANAELADVEDTFAELDKQYHVAVDHDFIENDDLCNPEQDFNKNHHSDLSIKQEKDIKDELQPSLDLFTHHKNVHNDETDFHRNAITPMEDTTYQHSCQMKEMDVKSNNNDNENSDIIATQQTKASVSANSRKRTIEQKPSHRKEKRKKMQEKCDITHKTNNKNENLHDNDVNVCITKEKIQSSKSAPSIISKKDEKTPPSQERRKSTSEKNYSDKYVKRKEGDVKQNNNRKRQTSTSSNHSISPKNNDTSMNVHTPSKSETKITLKTIDMFMEQPKKVNLHHAFRNTAHQINATNKKIAEIKPKPTCLLNQKSAKKHDVGTQVIKRLLSKETQTFESKSSTSRFCQTVKTKCATKGIQTDVQLPNKSNGSKSTDAFERMKEIDLEIQVLLQEKFKLYNSLESKEGAIPMQSLGMTVLNVGTLDENKESNDELEDDIVNNFTSIPEEELEQIAFETAQENQNQSFVSSRRNQRRKELQNRPDSESPHGFSKSNKKSKSPNISLIEQIITDDRPLEDIISLDDLEVTPIKSKPKIRQKPKKKAAPKRKNKGHTENVELKDCYVLLLQEDFSKYSTCNKIEQIVTDIVGTEDVNREYQDDLNYITDTKRVDDTVETIIEETIVNDLQFDMLDVSEDIVIGDNCEVKCTDEKVAIDNPDVPICEEIILDNSQSSMEDVTTPAENQGGECKLYDYSSDENLQRDSLIVSGNADAILAIECVEQNFLAAGLDGNVYYFNGDGQLITTLRGSNLAVTCLTIVKEKYGTTVYTGSLDSRIRYYDLETGLEKGPECNVLSPIQTMDRAWDTVFVGTRTGFVLQFECKNNMLIPVSTVKFSDQSILALRAMKEGPRKVLLVAARSENVTIRDAQTGLLLRTLCGPKMTVYTLLYEDGKVYCGTSSHQIQVFDYTSGVHVGTHEGGKGAVCLRATGGLVFAGCYDGCVYVYREGEPRPLAQLRGPSLMLLSLAVLGSKIIAGFKDRSLYIWKIPLCILQEMIL
ncbi:MATH and LRR domain-containing protein PFE0570w [Zerene cesonia]|uniref:MATH and LRR domain-containing protein PFE0570w n=1 Tax=Zerene cesonia TaxID=33412 RepID=UPI0018E56A4C|nr:MATH and LRR domain-containing protein PFE0570w [Zerene cesonia]